LISIYNYDLREWHYLKISEDSSNDFFKDFTVLSI